MENSLEWKKLSTRGYGWNKGKGLLFILTLCFDLLFPTFVPSCPRTLLMYQLGLISIHSKFGWYPMVSNDEGFMDKCFVKNFFVVLWELLGSLCRPPLTPPKFGMQCYNFTYSEP